MTVDSAIPAFYVQAFLGGAGVFLLLAATIALQVWLLTRRSGQRGDDVGSNLDAEVGDGPPVATPPKRKVWWHAVALVLFLLAKTAIVGGALFWCLWVKEMNPPAFFGGLVFGLALLVTASMVARSGLAKKQN